MAQVIEPQMQRYFNANSCRHYVLELMQDLMGDWVVTKYYGQQRKVIVHSDAEGAHEYFKREDRRRIQRHYRRVN